ncbi:MAG: hypothetical protein DMG25_10545 [Acidobacteria bacterium]|nr:MAG: hypothetical protein DMG25_10545 [Acidobacteriota bacterium]
MARIRTGALRVFLTTLLWGPSLNGQGIPASKPVWRTDLRQLGLRQEHFQFVAPPSRMRSEITRDSIAFGRSGHIAVAFLTQVLSRDLPSIGASRQVHLILLDAATGKVVANRTWPAPGATLNNVYVAATREGSFVVLQGNALRVYSSELREINRLDVTADPSETGSWSLLVPPGGDSVFLWHYLIGGLSLRMLSATTLREIRSWNKAEETGGAWTSGKYFAKVGTDKNLYVRGFDTPWRAIADLSHCRGGWGTAATKFINEDSLIVSGCDPVRLIRVDGHILFTAHPPKGRLAADAWGSLDGRFVAVATTTMGGLKIALALDMSSGTAPRRILIYDTKSGNPVGSLKYTWQHACAFSPDNSALALLSGGIVELFRLPQPNRRLCCCFLRPIDSSP